METKAKLGPWGEALAAAFLRRRGYHIVATNYRSRYGEIDIIAENAEYLVFAEVKTRTGAMLDRPAAAVDARKQNRLILAAQQYLQHSPYRDAAIRFDVVEVTPAARGWQVHCIPGAFECCASLGPLCEGAPAAAGGGENLVVAAHFPGQ